MYKDCNENLQMPKKKIKYGMVVTLPDGSGLDLRHTYEYRQRKLRQWKLYAY